MPPFRLPVVDPEILLLTALVGAVLGALGAGALYVGNKWAEETGLQQQLLPPLQPLIGQEQPA